MATPMSIKEMRQRGYCSDTIRSQIEREEGEYYRSYKANQLIDKIDKAFDEENLGNGVGLHEAIGLDDYADRATLKKLRESDIKGDWRDLSSDQLNKYHDSLSFFDDEGMRFHLPAFMTAELKEEFHYGMAFPLTFESHSEYKQSKFVLLNEEQRQVVREFLLFLLDHSDYESDKPQINDSLENYWL